MLQKAIKDLDYELYVGLVEYCKSGFGDSHGDHYEFEDKFFYVEHLVDKNGKPPELSINIDHKGRRLTAHHHGFSYCRLTVETILYI